jgi:chemotaxis protein MotB
MFEASVTKPPQRPDWLPWTLSVFGVSCAVFVLVKGVLPARAVNDELTAQVTRLQATLGSAEQTASQDRKARDELNEQLAVARQELGRAIEEKEKALARLESARKDLTKSLEREIAAGDVLVEERDGRLVIDVADEVLFDTGDAEVSRKGKGFLLEVAKSMRRLPDEQVYQVGGHTDSRPITTRKLVERYPTNWELSTSRATNVARVLEEEGHIPGKQLVAAGFAQYRPTSNNRTRRGRRQNRRIEIVLLDR